MTDLVVDVRTPSRPYSIRIGEGLSLRLASLIGPPLPSRQFFVSSPVVWKVHGERLSRALPDRQVILVADGERAKQLHTVSRIYDALVQAEADRASAIIAVGGGVIGDMAGFAAATFLRGIPIVHVPTTLLAQVDSAVGGKVGVNHPLGKNLIGAFHQPALVAVDPELLTTLTRREFRAGLYEVVKYGMTSSRDLFDRVARDLPGIFDRRMDSLVPIIADSCRIKAEVVSADEREAGPRRILNFGHTAGHALEAVTKYRRFRHGEAIGYGMLVAADLAVARGLLTESARQELATLIGRLGSIPRISDVRSQDIVNAVRHDKKVIAGKLHYVLPTAVGATTIVDDVTGEELESALRKVGFA